MAPVYRATIESANKALFVDGNLEAVADFFTDDYVVHMSGQDISGGQAIVKKIVRACRRAFSNIQVNIEVLVKSKDRIAWQRTLSAVHTGPFRGFPATHRPIVWHEMITSELRGGLIAKEWVVTDLAEKLLLARKKS